MKENLDYQKYYNLARSKWNSLAKPLYGLGAFEEAVCKICAVKETVDLPVHLKKAVVVLAADHGVVAEGVTQAEPSVTQKVAGSIAEGTAVISLMAKEADADVYVIDAGMDTEPYAEKSLVMGAVVNRKIARGSKNLRVEAAMTAEEVRSAMDVGRELVRELADMGYDMIAVGEMGIGNTTPATALAAYLLDLDPKAVTGRGAGLTDEGLTKKVTVIEDALHRVRTSYPTGCGPRELLAELGGYEIAMMVGMYLGAGEHRIPIVIDGAIAAVAALLADAILAKETSGEGGLADYLLASHMPAELTGSKALSKMGLSPAITAGLCHGEGTGAVMLFPLLEMALAVFEKAMRFEGLGIDAYTEDGKPEG